MHDVDRRPGHRRAEPNFRLLRYFVTLAEERLFGRAARLHIAQPAPSHQIMRPETQLGAPLFVRDPRGIHLTHVGDVLLPGVPRALRAAELAVAAASARARPAS